MHQRRLVGACVAVLAVVTLAGIPWLVFRPRSHLADHGTVEHQDREPTEAVAVYIPKTAGRLDDLSTPAEPLLRQLPGVVHVEAAVPAKEPTHRIVHLRDWHFIPRDLYALELRSSTGKSLTLDEVDRRYEKFCLEVDAVQMEQMTLLRSLKHHGLKRVYAEGLTEANQAAYDDYIRYLRETQETLQGRLTDISDLKGRMEANGRQETLGYQKATTMEGEVRGMMAGLRNDMLKVGAAGRLLITGEIEQVLPLDDEELLEGATPVTQAGRVRFDPKKVMARQDAIVKAAIAKEPLALIVLGGSHDLSESVRRVAGGRCEYIRVTTRRFKELDE